ncbi:RecQ family ATP-dependent DNA helicase [Singulisphaera sp. Ch08]|uniref:ATP-dependent DNA helicase RecQ n=1 Tax=Singulisphaera sp. Ch08 TaxID=3120278 RepID=A0AAU7CMD3_9BACT
MTTALEAEVVEVMKDLDGAVHIAQIQRGLRNRGGRPVSEDLLLRLCRQSPRLREVASGRFALLAHLTEEMLAPTDSPPCDEPETGLPLVGLSAVRGRSYVTFDLETTGTDPVEDAIIQIGAVRIDQGEVTGIFFEPVHPGDRTIPTSLRQVLKIELDGPMDRLIRHAEPWEVVWPRFREFVGDRPLVAHNAHQLDLPFLQSRGLGPDHPVLDSLELAWLVLPHLDRHSLESLAEMMGFAEGSPEVLALIESETRVTGTGHHNAVYDAAVLQVVLVRLLERLDDLLDDDRRGPGLRALLADMLGEVPSGIDEEGLAAILVPRGFPEDHERPSAGRIFSGSEEATRGAFEGHVRTSGRHMRPGQVEMVRLVAKTLNEGGVRVIEAPTGTGKSLGLAFPAVRHALATGHRVLLSTHTRHLQDQLEDDLAGLRRDGGVAFRYAVLKGRGNYLCVRALARLAYDTVAAGPDPSSRATRYMLACLIGWAAHQASEGLEGDLESVPFGLRERFASAQRTVAAVRGERGRCDSDLCRGTRGCFRAQARAKATAADVVVINHALWLSPAADDFPEFAGVLLDEAHELEDAATSAWSEEVSRAGLATLLAEILAPGDREGLLPRVLRRTGPDGGVRDAARGAFGAVRQARAEVIAFGRGLAAFLLHVGFDPRRDHGATCRIRADGRREYPTRWTSLDRSWRLLDAALDEVERRLRTLAAAIDHEPTEGLGEAEPLLLADRVRELRRTLAAPFGRQEPAWVVWFEAQARPEDDKLERPTWAIRRAPVHVAERIADRFDTSGGIVLTSATLTTRGGEYGFFLGRLGLDRTVDVEHLHTLPGAFDGRNALFLIPRYLQHAPRGASLPFFTRELAAELDTLFDFTRGRGLALFTARKRLEEVATHLEETLTPTGIEVLVQRPGFSKRHLREHFRDGEHSVLLGLKSFWQGVDVPGPSCSLVVMEKLPFPPYGDPVVDARREAVAARGGSEFEDYLLPLALLGLKQGFGRLLRSPEDRGAVFLMDRRIHERTYKADILRTLPGPARAPASEISRCDTYRAIAAHLPDLFAGRDLPSLLAALPAELLSEIAREVERWDLPLALTDAQYDEQRPAILEFLRRVFGHEGFRLAEQEEIVRAVLMGRDVLGLLPTGSGKSLTFQLPALLRRGLTLVISPLIALMRDQVEKLRALQLDMVDSLTSHQDAGEREDVLRRAKAGRLRLLYVSPERLRDPQLLAALEGCQLAQLVVDEAHCISMWGPTFRPDYVGIAPMVTALARRPAIVALTATATPEIQGDIERRLEMRDPVIIRGDFDRPEITYIVYNARSRPFRVKNQNDKFRIVYLLARTAERRGEVMIVYTATTRRAEEVAGKLAALGLSARAYHGKMEAEERAETQELFLDDHIRIVVATKAFGMGIDKPDVRYVIHYDVPGDLESYLQETGRAGRDGRPAWAVMLFREADRKTQAYFIEALRMEPGRVERILARLRPLVASLEPFELGELAAETDADELFLRILLFRLEESGWIRRETDVVTQASLVVLAEPGELREEFARDPEETGVSSARVLTALEAIPAYRRETVEVPRWAAEIGVEAEQLDRILASLAVRGHVNYRPFGRALRFSPGPHFGATPPRLRAGDPLIDGKYDKLDQMLAYARSTTGCRRRTLLEYLGQAMPLAMSGCGSCDACGATGDVPWKDERLADVPNPSLLFDPERVALELIEANVARAREENRAPLSRQTLRSILLGNAYGVLRHVREPYLRDWKDRRLRSFRQWGLLASLPGRGVAIETLFDRLVGLGWATNQSFEGADAAMTYTYLGLTDMGLHHVLSSTTTDSDLRNSNDTD